MDRRARATPRLARRPRPVRAVAERLAAYFAGEPVGFADLPTAAAGTPWQQRVWAALREIPYGATTTYGALAARLGAPDRRARRRRRQRPQPDLDRRPCHRVIGASGELTGYAGGLERKRALLALEAPEPPPERRERISDRILKAGAEVPIPRA